MIMIMIIIIIIIDSILRILRHSLLNALWFVFIFLMSYCI